MMSLCSLVNHVDCFLYLSSQGNHTELCTNCRRSYKHLNELYSGLEKNMSLCVDIEDAVRPSGADVYRASLHDALLLVL